MGLSALFLLVAVICFVLAFVGVDFDGHSLIALGLVFFAGSGLVAGRIGGPNV